MNIVNIISCLRTCPNSVKTRYEDFVLLPHDLFELETFYDISPKDIGHHFIGQTWLFKTPRIIDRLCLIEPPQNMILTFLKGVVEACRIYLSLFSMLYNIENLINDDSSISTILSGSFSFVKRSSILKFSGSIFIVVTCKCKVECIVMSFWLYVDFLVSVTTFPFF